MVWDKGFQRVQNLRNRFPMKWINAIANCFVPIITPFNKTHVLCGRILLMYRPVSYCIFGSTEVGLNFMFHLSSCVLLEYVHREGPHGICKK